MTSSPRTIASRDRLSLLNDLAVRDCGNFDVPHEFVVDSLDAELFVGVARVPKKMTSLWHPTIAEDVSMQ